MSSSISLLLTFVGKQITIYGGIFTLITGVIGGLLNIVVFLSLRTFRQSPCAFYLTIMSIFNVGQMLTGLLSRIMESGFGINWSQISLFLCKFRFYFFQVCAFTSMTCICLATIDQYLVTCARPQWQQWSNIKLARQLSAIFVLIWILHFIPYLIYYNHVISNVTGTVTCINTNVIFQQYLSYGVTIVLGKFLPIGIQFFFGFLAYHNVRQLAYRALPLVRRELDKQLTVMVLLLVVVAFFTVLPYSIISVLSTIPSLTQDPIIAAQLQFASLVTTYLWYLYFASPFYIFLCASNRFRQQLMYVLFDIYLKRWRRRRIEIIQVIPQPI